MECIEALSLGDVEWQYFGLVPCLSGGVGYCEVANDEPSQRAETVQCNGERVEDRVWQPTDDAEAGYDDGTYFTDAEVQACDSQSVVGPSFLPLAGASMENAELWKHFVAQLKTAHSSAAATLKRLLEAVSDKVIWLERDGDGIIMCYDRRRLMAVTNAAKLFYPSSICSWERGLKHAGLCVRQTSHGTNTVKIWQKRDVEPIVKRRR